MKINNFRPTLDETKAKQLWPLYKYTQSIWLWSGEEKCKELWISFVKLADAKDIRNEISIGVVSSLCISQSNYDFVFNIQIFPLFLGTRVHNTKAYYLSLKRASEIIWHIIFGNQADRWWLYHRFDFRFFVNHFSSIHT